MQQNLLVGIVVQAPAAIAGRIAPYFYGGLPAHVHKTADILGVAVVTPDKPLRQQLADVLEAWAQQSGYNVVLME